MPFLLLVFFAIAGCSDDVQISTPNIEVEKVRSVRIQLDSLTPFDVVPVVPWQDSDELYLFLSNPWNNSIDIYGVEAGRLVRRLVPEAEGKALTSVPRTVAVLNLDSIYVFDRGLLANAVLMNWEGEVLDARPLKYFWEEADVSPVFNHGGKVLYSRPYLFFKRAPLFYNPGDIGANMRGVSFEYRYDLSSDHFESLPVYLPDSYVRKGFVNYHASLPSRAIIEERGVVVYNWAAKKRLAFRSMEDFSLVREVEAHVPTWGKTLLHAPRVPEGDMQQEMEQALSHVLYETVLYDPWRKLIYRLALVPTEANWAGKDLTQDDFWVLGYNRLGIVILDDGGEMQGFVVLPAKRYWPYTSFVAREGLYISKNNIYRDDFSEDVLEYDVFRFRVGGD